MSRAPELACFKLSRTRVRCHGEPFIGPWDNQHHESYPTCTYVCTSTQGLPASVCVYIDSYIRASRGTSRIPAISRTVSLNRNYLSCLVVLGTSFLLSHSLQQTGPSGGVMIPGLVGSQSQGANNPCRGISSAKGLGSPRLPVSHASRCPVREPRLPKGRSSCVLRLIQGWRLLQSWSTVILKRANAVRLTLILGPSGLLRLSSVPLVSIIRVTTPRSSFLARASRLCDYFFSSGAGQHPRGSIPTVWWRPPLSTWHHVPGTTPLLQSHLFSFNQLTADFCRPASTPHSASLSATGSKVTPTREPLEVRTPHIGRAQSNPAGKVLRVVQGSQFAVSSTPPFWRIQPPSIVWCFLSPPVAFYALHSLAAHLPSRFPQARKRTSHLSRPVVALPLRL